MDNAKPFAATGRRKSSTARVRIKPGSGKRTVNGKPIEEFFPRPVLRKHVEEPFEAIGCGESYDLVASVAGGGMTGQAGAIRLGLARALVEVDEANRKALRLAGYLTRDPREKERKKYGLAGARKRYQFSKR